MNDNTSKDTCSIIVIMIVTSMQTDRQSIYGVCHEWLNGAIHGLWGIAAHHERHIRPHGNFMTSSVPGCLSSSYLSSIMNTSSMNDESSILYPLVFPLDCHVGIVVLSYQQHGDVHRRLANSAYKSPCPTKRAIASLQCHGLALTLIVLPITLAPVCFRTRTVCTSWKYHDPLTVYITASEAAPLSLWRLFAAQVGSMFYCVFTHVFRMNS